MGKTNEMIMTILDNFENTNLTNGLSFIWNLAEALPEVRITSHGLLDTAVHI